ncbi:DUF4811 domain-containing protein [Enterococcus raffinosus]|nr:DUF4811 domain-containing protein [Enterococcus raffinosus]
MGKVVFIICLCGCYLQTDSVTSFQTRPSKNHQLIKEKNIFNVQKDWLVLSTEQAKKLAKLVQDNKATMQSEAKTFVQNKVKAAMMQNPTMDQAAQQKIIQQATAVYQQQEMAKLVDEVTK